MTAILAFPMEISMAHGNFQVLEISRAHGNFHGPWKIPWPMEISMGGPISPWTGSVCSVLYTAQLCTDFPLLNVGIVQWGDYLVESFPFPVNYSCKGMLIYTCTLGRRLVVLVWFGFVRTIVGEVTY